jgi:hypothetical protein
VIRDIPMATSTVWGHRSWWWIGSTLYQGSGKVKSRNIGHQDSRSREVRNPDEVMGPLKSQSRELIEVSAYGTRESENRVARHRECSRSR